MAVNINLNDIQQEPIIVSANQTADLNKYYINTASATYTDPTPTEGKGFTVFVRNGTATVGGSAYAVAGTTIYRVYHSGVWANYTHNVIGTTSGTVCEGNDSRLNKDKTIALTVTSASHTGNTTETVKYTVSIPANTFTTGDRIYQEILATAIGGAGVKTIRTYINNTADLVTPVLISTYFTNNLAYSLTSSFFVDSSSTMKSYKLGSTNTAVFTGSSNTTIGTYSIDWTIDQYLVLSVQLANSADLIQLEALILKRDRA